MSDAYAVIGNPVAHSRSPAIHALFARQTGENVEYRAVLAPVDGFVRVVNELRAGGAKGANVTLPFKAEACLLSTRLSERARAAAAVNTLSFRDHEIHGDNTDGCGLTRDLTVNLGCAISGRRVLLLGAGGAARGVVLPLLEERPAALVIANRDSEKARALAKRFPGVAGCAYEELGSRSFDLVINATSASLSGAVLPLPPGVHAPGSFAYDMVYGRETDFIRRAKANGAAATADGLGMLIEQAAESFYIWRGVRPQTAPVLAAMRAG